MLLRGDVGGLPAMQSYIRSAIKSVFGHISAGADCSHLTNRDLSMHPGRGTANSVA